MHFFAMALGRKALVVKEFSINSDGPVYVHIMARKAGLISWFLTLFGVDSTTTFNVYSDRIEFREGSLSGQLGTVMPLRSISITTCGYTKPIVLLVFAVIFVLAAIPTFGISLLLAGLCLIFYFLNKSLLISVVSNSGWPALICFKRSVIEGINVDYDQAQRVIRIINELMLYQASE